MAGGEKEWWQTGGEISFRCTRNGNSSHTLREKNTEDAEGINQISMYLNTQAGIPIAKAMADMKWIAQQQGNKRKGLFIFKSLSWLHPGIWSLGINFFITSSLVMTVLLPKLKETKEQGNSPKFPMSPSVVKGALLSEHEATFWTYLQHHRFFFLLVDGNVCAVNPGICAQVSETDIGVSKGRQ